MSRILFSSRTIFRLLAMVAALLVATPALAITTGSLRIVVVDEDDFVLPNANVTLSSDGGLLGGNQDRPTDADGEVTFSQLLPGKYIVDVSKAGFAGRRVIDLQINLNRVTEQRVVLPLEGESEVIEVTAKKPAVDVESTSRGQVLSKEFLNRIPAGRSYQSAVTTAAGVVDTGGGGNPSMSGGAYNENTYMLDGANITDPVTGTFSVNFNFDAIQQIEVLLGGYMPEYGVSQGGIVNIVTTSGTNNLEFVSAIYYTNANIRPRMDARYTADGFDLGPSGFDSEYQSIQVSSLVSGPVVRDRAWYVISYQHSRSIFANTGIPQTRDYDGHYVQTKLTVQPNSEHRVTAMFQLDPTAIDNIDQGNPYQKAEAQGRQAQGGFIGSGRWQWFLSPDVNVDTNFVVQKTYIEVNAVPCTHDPEVDYHPCKPGEMQGDVDWETPYRSGLYGAYDSVNYGYYYFDDRWRYTGASKISLVGVEDPWGGKHDFKMGVEGSQLIWDQIQGYAGNMYYLDMYEVAYDPDSFLNYGWLEISGPIKFRTSASQWNTFVQDSWKPVKNLTVKYGTRFDQFVNRNDLGEPVISGALFGPRLYGSWDPFGDQKTKVSTGYGRFNDTSRLSVAAFTSAASYGSKFYAGEFWDNQEGEGYLNHSSVMYDYGPNVNTNSKHDQLRTPRVDEVILLLEREVVEDLAAFSRMAGKFSRYQYEQDDVNLVYDSDGSAVIGSRIANSNESRYRMRTPTLAKRDYFQWDLGLNKVEARRWSAMVTYTYTQSIGSSSSAFSGSFANAPQTQYNYGPLNTDINHVVKATGFWKVPTDPWSQNFGMFFQWYSGFPLQRFYESENQYGTSYNLWIQPRGVYVRYGDWWDLSLKYQQDIDVRKGKFILDFEVQNITNNRAPNDPWSYVLNPENRLQTESRQSPLQLQFGLRYEF